MFRPDFFKRQNEIKINWQNGAAPGKIGKKLHSFLPQNPEIPVLFLCIGSDRSTGDSLGPLVGTLLMEKNLPANFHVFGTLEEPVHAMNLNDKLDFINKNFSKKFVVGIDACLGQSKNVGTIMLKKGALKPGAGVNKSLPPVGDIHLTGIVNIGGFMEFFVLQNTRLHLVMGLAKVIAEGIYRAGMLYRLKDIPVDENMYLKEDTV